MNIGVGGMHIGAVLPLGPGVIPGYQTADDLLQGSMQPCWAPWMSVTQSPCWDWREGLFMCTLPPHRAGLGIDTDGLLSPPCLISLSSQVNDWNRASSNIIVIYFGCLHQNDNLSVASSWAGQKGHSHTEWGQIACQKERGLPPVLEMRPTAWGRMKEFWTEE